MPCSRGSDDMTDSVVEEEETSSLPVPVLDKPTEVLGPAALSVPEELAITWEEVAEPSSCGELGLLEKDAAGEPVAPATLVAGAAELWLPRVLAASEDAVSSVGLAAFGVVLLNDAAGVPVGASGEVSASELEDAGFPDDMTDSVVEEEETSSLPVPVLDKPTEVLGPAALSVPEELAITWEEVAERSSCGELGLLEKDAAGEPVAPATLVAGAAELWLPRVLAASEDAVSSVGLAAFGVVLLNDAAGVPVGASGEVSASELEDAGLPEGPDDMTDSVVEEEETSSLPVPVLDKPTEVLGPAALSVPEELAITWEEVAEPSSCGELGLLEKDAAGEPVAPATLVAGAAELWLPRVLAASEDAVSSVGLAAFGVVLLNDAAGVPVGASGEVR
ncbi:Hypothetical predicted protein [Podarcis lilfordi]|uniref:Uncharacterized protein n=1 Tax=Podarcis lilfordi TaxID=74358 RepID=A0AA35K8K3_9SAUR|nr:Hypothetical predicted protein [Podarcis lilfordi]